VTGPAAAVPEISTDAELPPGAEPIPRTQWQLFRRRFFKHRLAIVSLVVLAILMVACFGAPWLAPYPQNKQNLLASAAGPSAKHWLGIDDLGRDQLSELMYAGRISLMIGLVVALLSTILGVAIGALAGFYGGWIDQVLSRTTDLFLIVPDLAILAVMLQKFGRSASVIIIVFAVLGWTYVARILRGEVLSIKEKEFVEAARASGASNRRIIVQQILPNTIGSIMVNATLAVAAAVVLESTLSFLGFGIQPPQNSWGRMLSDAEAYTTDTHKFFLILFPGLALTLTVLAVSFLGDGLRDAFDPQRKQ
jgi:peptide/nickel transport system permease protein